MNALFPGEKEFRNRNERMEVTQTWSSTQLDWKAKVVCEPCNNGWMSNIESQHALPAMTDLIAGKLDIPIAQSRADSIALFAFKTAVIVEHLKRNQPARFFPRSVRHRFRETLEIPHNVRMWFAGFLPPGKGRCITLYYTVPTAHGIELYVCNYVVGRLVFQVVAEKGPSSLTLVPIRELDQFAVPLWPSIPPNFIWPPLVLLKTVEEFRAFAERWSRLDIFNITGGH